MSPAEVETVTTPDPLWVPIEALPRLPLVEAHVHRGSLCGLVCAVESDHLIVAIPDSMGLCEMPRDGWQLYFGDASTRDRAARWLAQQHRMPLRSTAPMWVQLGGLVGSRARWWDLYGAEGSAKAFTGDEIPALDALAPTNDERLADGSRRVDAEALAIVCRHVGAL